MTRKLFFTQIADDRFNQNEMDLIHVHKKLTESLSKHDSLEVTHSKIREVEFSHEIKGVKYTNKQWRIDYLIEKQGRKLTWNQVYEIVNSVKVVSFELK